MMLPAANFFGVLPLPAGPCAPRPLPTPLPPLRRRDPRLARARVLVLQARPRHRRDVRRGSLHSNLRRATLLPRPAGGSPAALPPQPCHAGAPPAEAQSLIASKTVTLPLLLTIAPEGTVDPSPLLYDDAFYTLAGFSALACVCNLAAYRLPRPLRL